MWFKTNATQSRTSIQSAFCTRRTPRRHKGFRANFMAKLYDARMTLSLAVLIAIHLPSLSIRINQVSPVSSSGHTSSKLWWHRRLTLSERISCYGEPVATQNTSTVQFFSNMGISMTVSKDRSIPRRKIKFVGSIRSTSLYSRSGCSLKNCPEGLTKAVRTCCSPYTTLLLNTLGICGKR